MENGKINSTNMRQHNAKLVLDRVRFSHGISRKALAEEIGLTSATITNIVSTLLREGYVIETGEQQSSAGGRRRVLLSVNPCVCYALGVELSAGRVNCLLTDFSANILARKATKLALQPSGREEVLCSLVDTINETIRLSGVPREKIRGVGLSTPGPYDLQRGMMLNPPNMQCMKNTPIRDIIEQRVGIPVVFEHHMAAAGFCESWFGRANSSECLFLCAVLEVGVAGSLLIDGKIHHGYKNGSGEIGHMCIDPNGPRCACGNYGCLEPLAQGHAVTDAVRRRFFEDAAFAADCGVTDAEQIDIDFILERANAGDPVCRAELLRSARFIGLALSNIIVTVSPDTIVLMGEMPDKSPLYVNEVIRCIRERVYPGHNKTVRVYSTGFKRDVSALGGVAMVLDTILTSAAVVQGG